MCLRHQRIQIEKINKEDIYNNNYLIIIGGNINMLKRNVFSGLLVALFALTMIGGATAAPAKQPDFNVNVCVGQEFTITVPDYPWIEGEGDFSWV